MGDAVVNEVLDELREFITSNNIPVDVTSSENQVILAAKTSDKTLKIICYDQAQFQLKDNVGNHRGDGTQTQVTVEPAHYSPSGRPFTRSDMLAKAKRWLSEQRPKPLR
jgi:hypothetical protein